MKIFVVLATSFIAAGYAIPVSAAESSATDPGTNSLNQKEQTFGMEAAELNVKLGSFTKMVSRLNDVKALANADQAEDQAVKDFRNSVRLYLRARAFSLINANDQQRKEISDYLDQRFEEGRQERENLKERLLSWLDAFAQSDVQDEQLTADFMKFWEERTAMMKENLKTVLKVRSLLTPTQRKDIVDVIQAFINGNWRPMLIKDGKPGKERDAK